MAAYYNENDRHAAAWLRELIAEGLIAAGDVDERSITDVRADDIRGYGQCHFFAGIGGWSYALRLSGWPDGRPVWTGSCPCQPFSVAGQRGGGGDDRHLWPAWYGLIRECRPNRVFGEQVEGAVGHGWLDAVFTDLEGEGYACGAAVLGAHSVGAPHIRQRLYWVANAGSSGQQFRGPESGIAEAGPVFDLRSTDGSEPSGLAYAEHAERGPIDGGDERDGYDDGRPQAHGEPGTRRQVRGSIRAPVDWRDVQWLPCRDGKARPVEPGISPLASGLPARVVRLRGYGNSIVPQVGAAFVSAFMDAAADRPLGSRGRN